MTVNAAAWFLTTLIYFFFSFLFWRFGNDPIRPFTFRRRGKVLKDELPEEFVRDLDGYMQSINARNKVRYRTASGGFLVAGLTSILLSLTLSF